MSFDYSKLSGLIEEKFGTRAKFALAMGFSERTLSLKMSGKVEWKPSEMCKACEIFGIEKKDIPIYFFTPKVQYA